MKIGVLDLLHSAVPAPRVSATSLNRYFITKQFASVMPQTVSVWCREMGHDVYYATYWGQSDPEELLPKDIQMLFISSYTQASGLAYALARIFSKAGAVTVLGGPHAKAFPQDSLRFFDFVVQQCDQETIKDIVNGQCDTGSIIKSAQPPKIFASVEQRMPEIKASVQTRGRTYISTTVPMLASIGCPYSCNFCIDWDSDYQTVPDDQLEADLNYIGTHLPGARMGFADPNFAIRFDQTLGVLERVPENIRPAYLMESSLSALKEHRLQRLKDTKCYFIAPGIESWTADYSGKAGTQHSEGWEKVTQVADHFALLHEYVPAFQGNVIFGLDIDKGEEPVIFTKEFMDRTPWVWTTLNIPQPFGGTPLFDQYLAEDRILRGMPFMFYYQPYLTTTIKNYEPLDYYEKFSSMISHASTRKMWLSRMKSSRSLTIKSVMTLRTMAVGDRIKEMENIKHALKTDPLMEKFHAGRTEVLPKFYENEYKRILGKYTDVVSIYDLKPTLI